MAQPGSDCLYKTEVDKDLIHESSGPSTSSDVMDCSLVDQLFDSVDLDCSFPPTDLPTDLTDCKGISFNGCLPSDKLYGANTERSFREALRDIDHFLSTIDDAENASVEAPLIKQDDLVNTDVLVKKHSNTGTTKKKCQMKKGHRYAPNFKRKVLNFAVKHTFKETSSKFGVNRNTLTDWAREYKRLLILKKSTITRSGSILTTDEPSTLVTNNETDPLNQKMSLNEQIASDATFLLWLKKKRQTGYRVGREEVLTAALTSLNTCRSTSAWFASWVRRNAENKDIHGMVDLMNNKAEKHIIYPASFKLEVALFAKNNSKLLAARTFGVSSRRLYEWCERLDAQDEDLPTAAPAHRVVDEQLLSWYQQRSANGQRPKSIEIMEKARELYAARGLSHVKCSQGWLYKARKRLDLKMSYPDDDELLLWVLAQLDNNVSLSLVQVTSKARELAVKKRITNFKGSKGWTLRFLKRHSHLLQCSSARLSDLPGTAVVQARSFSVGVRQRISVGALSPASFGCMDEVPITFTYPTEKVLTPPLLRKAGLSLVNAVVLLAATSDGRLLPPAVVLKGTRAIQTFTVGKLSMPVIHCADGDVDADTLTLWTRHVWFREVLAPSMLIIDSFAPHLDEKFTEELSTGCCHVAVIPPGCAVHLQPCSFNLSRRFQEIVQEEYTKHLTTTTSLRGTKSSPGEALILDWVTHAYNTLRQDDYSIRSSFHLTGLVDPNSNLDSILVHNKD